MSDVERFRIACPFRSATTVTLTLTDLSGASVSSAPPATIPLPAGGQTATFLREIFPALPASFQGVLRIASASPVTAVGLRTRTNERGDFLITTTPPSNENGGASASEVFFPQIANGGGYSTQFILYSGTAGQPPGGSLAFFREDGSAFALRLN